nr:hypothetical protein CFP56_58603 [Quercus suber]
MPYNLMFSLEPVGRLLKYSLIIPQQGNVPGKSHQQSTTARSELLARFQSKSDLIVRLRVFGLVLKMMSL